MRITNKFALDCLKLVAEGINTSPPKSNFHNFANSPLVELLNVYKSYPIYDLQKSNKIAKRLTGKINLIFLSNFITEDKNILEVIDNDNKINIIIFKDNIKKIIKNSIDNSLGAIQARDIFTNIFNTIFYLCDSNYSKISLQKNVYETSVSLYPGIFGLKLAMNEYPIKFIPHEILIYDGFANLFNKISIPYSFLRDIDRCNFESLVENNLLISNLINLI